MTRGILLCVILCALTALALTQEQGQRTARQSGWYSSRDDSSRGGSSRSDSSGRRPYSQPSLDDDDEPSFGTREDYESRDPGYGRRSRPGSSRSSSSRTSSSRRPVSQPDSRSRQPVLGGYPRQPQPDTPRQPVYPPSQPQPPPYSPRQPGYDPRQPQPPPDAPRQPVFGGYDPRPPLPETPRQPVFGGYDPRPPVYEPRQPVYDPRPPPYDPRPPVYNPPQQPSLLIRQPQLDNLNKDEIKVLPIGGVLYTGPDNIGGPHLYIIGKEHAVGDRGEVRRNNCKLSCRGQCTTRDFDNCQCVQNMTCFNELKHRLLVGPGPELLVQNRPPSAPCPDVSECGECGYLVMWPDNFCLCEQDPNCPPARIYRNNYRKREVDLNKLILQRDAHMAELKRASRHSKKTKRHTMTHRFN